MTDIENARLSGRHGAAWRELGFGTLDSEGNWEPFDDAPSPFDGLRTLGLIVVLGAVSVAWVVAAVLR